MGSRGPPSVHADQKAMEVTKTTDVDDFEPDDLDELEEGSQRKQKRARESNYMQKDLPPPSESGYHSEGEHTVAATNASTKDANERPDDALYWAKIAPPDARQEQTPAQTESAKRITVEDLAACCAIVLTQINEEDDSIPDRFEQTGVYKTEDDRALMGLHVAFASTHARRAYIEKTNGFMQVSNGEDADVEEAQVVYTVKIDSSQPEMAYALLRKQSARMIVYTKGAPFKLPVLELQRAILKQTKGITIVYPPRRGSELDQNGKPLRDILGPKPEIYLRIGKTGDDVSLPGVIIIRSFPFRYKIQPGYFKTAKGTDLCNACHHDPCECDEIKEDVSNSLDYKNAVRKKKQAFKEGGTSAGDARAQRLAKRGAKGKEAITARTARQKSTPCQNYWDKGKCKYGEKCLFSHSIAPDRGKSRCNIHTPPGT